MKISGLYLKNTLGEGALEVNTVVEGSTNQTMMETNLEEAVNYAQ